MSSPIVLNWPGSWVVDGTISGVTLAGAANVTSAVISASGALDTELSFDLTYGGTATPAIAYICRDVDGTNFESPAVDSPFGFTLPANVSGRSRRTIAIPASDASKFQVVISNPSGNSTLTGVTLRTKQSAGAVG